MNSAKYIFGGFAILLVFLLFGCTGGPQVGGDRDAHGCIPSAGYEWCEEKQKCIRPWEENCTELVGGDRDAHGCIPSAGYSWCEEKQKCLRVWEEPCTAQDRAAKAKEFCNQSNVAQVSVCGDVIKVVTSLIGGGSTFYKDDGTKVVCPVVSPDYQTTECTLLISGSNCIEKIICDNTKMPTPDFRIVTEEFAPYNFKGSDGKATGQSTEIVRELLKRTGGNENDDIEIMSISDAYGIATGYGSLYVLIYSLSRTPEREPNLKWVGPIGSWDMTMYARNDTAIAITNLDGAKLVHNICVVQGDARQQLLARNGFFNLVLVQNDGECAKKLMAGEVSLWFGSSESSLRTLKANGFTKDSVRQVLQVQKDHLYIAFSTDVPDETVQQWQSALDKMKTDGTYDTIHAKWFS